MVASLVQVSKRTSMGMKRWLGPQDEGSLRGHGGLSTQDMSGLSTSLTIALLDACGAAW